MDVYRRQQRYPRQEGAGRRCVVLARPSQPEEPIQPQGTPIAIPKFEDLANSRQYEGMVADKVCFANSGAYANGRDKITVNGFDMSA
jgi:hypothetical protein